MVPIDFSDTSLNAMKAAVKMCKRHGATLHLLYVPDTEYLYPVAGMHTPLAGLAREMAISQHENLKNLAASISYYHHIDCYSHCETGRVARTICSVADATGSDLVVMGTNPKTKPEDFLVDSIAYRVLKSANCPVLTIPGKKRFDFFRNIVFPVRPVQGAVEKYQFVRNIVRKNNASVHLVGAMQRNIKAGFANVRSMLAELLHRLDEDNVPQTYELHLCKDPVEKVLETCRNISADLIVINASTQRSLSQFFYGNYAQQMMGNPDAAVLCIKPAARRKDSRAASVSQMPAPGMS